MDTQKLTELVKGLSQQEAEEVINRVQVAMDNEVEKYVSDKAAKQQAALLAEYKAEMLKPENRGKPHILKAIKDKWRARGAEVDTVVFS